MHRSMYRLRLARARALSARPDIKTFSRSFSERPSERRRSESLQTPAAARGPPPALSLSLSLSAFRRRDNHISRAITCLCISIIPWRRSPGILARIPRIFYALAYPQDQPDPELRARARARARESEKEREREREREDGRAQRTALISLIELGTRDCCNYDYL